MASSTSPQWMGTWAVPATRYRLVRSEQRRYLMFFSGMVALLSLSRSGIWEVWLDDLGRLHILPTPGDPDGLLEPDPEGEAVVALGDLDAPRRFVAGGRVHRRKAVGTGFHVVAPFRERNVRAEEARHGWTEGSLPDARALVGDQVAPGGVLSNHSSPRIPCGVYGGPPPSSRPGTAGVRGGPAGTG